MSRSPVIEESKIAPCGLNCALCRISFRENKICDGCNGSDLNKPQYCIVCQIRNCELREGTKPQFCYTCEKFPCARLKRLDKRYRTKYRVSIIENLVNIRDKGIQEFIREEKMKWKCPRCGETLSMHKGACLFCGTPR